MAREMRCSANPAAIRANRSSGTVATAKAWETVTRPASPSALVRAMMASICHAPSSPRSWRWMSTLHPWRSAIPNTTSRWRTGSRSNPAGSSPTDGGAAGGDGGVHQLGGARFHQHPALGKGPHLDRDPVPAGFSSGQHPFDTAQSGVGIDVDVAAHRGHSVGDAGVEQGPGPLRHRGEVAAGGPFVGDQPGQVGPAGVGPPREPPQRLVEMGMGVDQPGEEQLAPAVELDRSLPAGTGAAHDGDPAVIHHDVGERATHRSHPPQDQLSHAAQYPTAPWARLNAPPRWRPPRRRPVCR